MTKTELFDYLIKSAKKYSPTAAESIKRNSHMNGISGVQMLFQDEIDATLVDFINFMGMEQGMDIGLYAKDLSI